MPSLETTYLAVRGAVVDAIKAAWNPANGNLYFDPYHLAEDYAGGYPVVFIDARIDSWENETPKTDEVVVAFEITGVFANNISTGNDRDMIVNLRAAQAQLYAVLNMGTYGYLGQMSDPSMTRLDGNNRYAVGFTYRCAISIDRT
jgi:hypothetical protein